MGMARMFVMKTRVWWLLVAGLVLVASLAPAQVIVANPSVKVSEISKSDLASIFTGASSNFKDGSRAVPVVLKGGSTHEAFLSKYLDKNDAAFRATWRSVLFAGKGTMPKAFDSDAALIDYVASTSGAIGYVSTDPPGRVKVLSVK